MQYIYMYRCRNKKNVTKKDDVRSSQSIWSSSQLEQHALSTSVSVKNRFLGKNLKKRPKRWNMAFLGAFWDFTPIGEKSPKTVKKAKNSLFRQFLRFFPDWGKISKNAPKGWFWPFWPFFGILPQTLKTASKHVHFQLFCQKNRLRKSISRCDHLVK